MHRDPAQAPAAMAGHRDGGRLLQGLVGEQPARHVDVGELGGGPAPQQDGLDQHTGVLPKTGTHRGDVGDAGRLRLQAPRHLGQRRGSRRAAQVADVGAGEPQDGLIPVIITL